MTTGDKARVQRILDAVLTVASKSVRLERVAIRGKDLPCWWVDTGDGWHATLATANDLIDAGKLLEASAEFGDCYGFTVFDLHLQADDRHVIRAVCTVDEDVLEIVWFEPGDWESCFAVSDAKSDVPPPSSGFERPRSGQLSPGAT